MDGPSRELKSDYILGLIFRRLRRRILWLRGELNRVDCSSENETKIFYLTIGHSVNSDDSIAIRESNYAIAILLNSKNGRLSAFISY